MCSHTSLIVYLESPVWGEDSRVVNISLMGASGLWKRNSSGSNNYLWSLELWTGKLVCCRTDRWSQVRNKGRGTLLRRWRRVQESFRGCS
jgi:hypothetical protein